MLKKSVSPIPTPSLAGSLPGRVERAWKLARWAIGRLPGLRKTRFTGSGLEQGGGGGAIEEYASDTSTLMLPSTQDTDRLAGFRRLGAGVASAFGPQSRPSGFVFSQPGREGEGLEQLASRAEPKLQLAVLTEALALLDEFDRRIITLRLAGDPYDSVAAALKVSPDAAGPRYALAVNRLGERLDWVATLERRGVSPPEREALGQVRFFGRTAQEVARRLRLNQEAVERWIRQSDLSTQPEPGAPS